jgi:aminotransferase
MFGRTEKLNLSVIKQIELKASKYADAISLAQGIPSFDTPLCIKRRVERALRRGVVAKYSLSPGLPELRELIEIQLAKENMFYDWEKEIIVTAGTIQGITATILAITEPGDEVIIPEPTYTSYREVIHLAGCTPVFVPLDESRGWSFELERFEQAITPKTRAIFFCNPNNPTGTIYSREQQLALAELAEKHDLFLISDEVYKDFIYDDEPIFSLAELPQYRERLIRIYGFSKAYAMTGWRVGYVQSSERISREILKVHDSLVTCAPVISQYAAMGALEMGETDLRAFNREYVSRRQLMCQRLDALASVFSYVYPRSSYYVFPKIKIPHTSAWDFALELLENTHVAVVPGQAFGPNGEGHIRLSFGRSQEDIASAFDRFDSYFSKS